MTSPFGDVFLPDLFGGLANAGSGMVEGMKEGALLKRQLDTQDLENRLKAFHLKMQQAPQWQNFQGGTTALQTDPATGQVLQQRQIPLDPYTAQWRQAQANLYAGGMYPPGSVAESMNRRLLTNPNDPQALQYFETVGKVGGMKAGGVTALDPQTVQLMAFRAMKDPQYHPQFHGPYGALDKQNFENALAGVQPQSPTAGAAPTASPPAPEQQAEHIIEQQTTTKLMRETTSAFGPKGKPGNDVRALNTALNHLDTIEQLAVALKNSDVRAVNRIRMRWQLETGQPLPASFGAAANIVGDELAKAMVGAGVTAEADRAKVAQTFATINSPEQWLGRQGVIHTYKSLMVGKLSELQRQYLSGMGQSPLAQQRWQQMLSPQVKGMSQKIAQEDREMKQSQQAVPPTNAKGWALMTDKDGNRAYVSPNGDAFEEVR